MQNQPAETTRSERLTSAIEAVFKVFSKFEKPRNIRFCTYCHSEDEIKGFLNTELRTLTEEQRRRLSWESSDHWYNTLTYKHYLPVILERLAPPNHPDAIYPEHLFNSLTAHNFLEWNEDEKQVVLNLFKCELEAVAENTDRDSFDWSTAATEFIEWCNNPHESNPD